MDLSPADQDLAALFRNGRYLVAAILLATLWGFESFLPMFAGRKRRLSHGATHLVLAVINGLVAYGGAFGILIVTEWSRREGIGLIHHVEMPEWARWAAAIVLFDIWQYWWHRFNHRVKLLWRFHAIHHSDGDMDATSGVRFHTIEIVLSIAVRLAVLPLIGMTVPQLLLYEAVSLPIILFHHSNVRLPHAVDVSLRWLIVTPWMHWVHHSDLQPETDSNYSSFLSVWDRIFGSFRLRKKPREIRLGLDGWEEHEWRGLWGMLAAPFRHDYGRRRTQTKEAAE